MIQNTKEQHKDILCLISLSDATRQQMKENGYDPDEAIKELKAIDNVDVGDITMQTISTIFRYKLVIIICHHVRKSNIDALELSDGTLLPVDSFVNAVVNTVNNRYTGLIDLCICDSENMAKSIKALSQHPDLYKIQYAEKDTGVEFRLCYIYPKLLQYFSFDSIKDYRIRYRESFLEAIEKAKKDQKEKIEDVTSLPEGTKLGGAESSEDVKTSVFFPNEVVRGEFYKLQIILHLDVDTGTLYFDIAKGNDPKTADRKTNVVLKNVYKGDYLLLNLSFLDGENRRPTKQLIADERDELTFEDDHYTKEIIVNDEDKTEITIHVKVNKDYNDIKFFTIIKFIKDDKCLMTFDLETGFKTEPFQNDSKEEGKRPIVKDVKSGFSDTPNIKEQLEKTKQGKIYKDTHKDEKMCTFVFPSFGDEDGWQIHDEVKRLVTRQGIQEICRYLEKMRKEEKIMLPRYNPSGAYKELVRMGMPNGEGFNEITFRKYYSRYCFKE